MKIIKIVLFHRVIVEHARGPKKDRFGGGRDRRRAWVDKYGPPSRTNYKLTVENLSSRVSWQDLKDLMRRAGEVTYANAHNDRRNQGYRF
jgi:arginine/serine-rich splicing factor 4/5/6